MDDLKHTPRHAKRREPLSTAAEQAVVIVLGVLAALDIAAALWAFTNGL